MIELNNIRFAIEEEDDAPGLYYIYLIIDNEKHSFLIGICRKDGDGEYFVDLKVTKSNDYPKYIKSDNPIDAVLRALSISRSEIFRVLEREVEENG